MINILKKKKGFTLVELLATITILGIIMLIAVPNVINIINNNKKTTYIEDAKRLVALAEAKFRSDGSFIRPKHTMDCTEIYLSDLDKSTLSEAPEGGTYDETASYVVVKYDAVKGYQYMVQLKEVYGTDNNNYRGIPCINSSSLNESDAMHKYVKTTGFVAANTGANCAI